MRSSTVEDQLAPLPLKQAYSLGFFTRLMEDGVKELHDGQTVSTVIGHGSMFYEAVSLTQAIAHFHQ